MLNQNIYNGPGKKKGTTKNLTISAPAQRPMAANRTYYLAAILHHIVTAGPIPERKDNQQTNIKPCSANTTCKENVASPCGTESGWRSAFQASGGCAAPSPDRAALGRDMGEARGLCRAPRTPLAVAHTCAASRVPALRGGAVGRAPCAGEAPVGAPFGVAAGQGAKGGVKTEGEARERGRRAPRRRGAAVARLRGNANHAPRPERCAGCAKVAVLPRGTWRPSSIATAVAPATPRQLPVWGGTVRDSSLGTEPRGFVNHWAEG